MNDEPVPVLALDRRAGHVAPAGAHRAPVAGDDEIVFGSTTLEHLGLHVGDTVTVAAGIHRANLKIVGTATLPSVGIGGGDHTSLGRAVLSYRTMADLVDPGVTSLQTENALCPQALLLDVAHDADGAAVVRRIASANPDGTPGGTYEQPVHARPTSATTTRWARCRSRSRPCSPPPPRIAFLVTLIASVHAERARPRDPAHRSVSRPAGFAPR